MRTPVTRDEQIQQWLRRYERYQGDFARSLRGANAAGLRLLELLEEHPKAPAVTEEFRAVVHHVARVVTTLRRRILR